jgi:hypothetical protein
MNSRHRIRERDHMAAGTAAVPPDDAIGCLVLPAHHQQGSHGSALAESRYSGKNPGSIAMCGRDDGPPRPAHTAFYGRTNAVGADAAVALARQFRQCQDAAGPAVITGVFYDAAGGVSHALTQMVRQLEPPAVRDGGWSDLTAEITSADHPVTMIVCESPDRIARRPAELRARLHLPARHGVTLLLADVIPHESVPADELERLMGITSPGVAGIPHGSVRRCRRRPAR